MAAINSIPLLGNPINIRPYEDHTSDYFTTYSNIEAHYDMVNWEGNRQPDPLRVNEIAEELKNNNRIDGMFYFVLNNDRTLICIDGIHRLTALRKLYQETRLQNLEHYLIVNILPFYNLEYIEKKFDILNKNVIVPRVDFVELNNRLTNYFTETYKSLFSASNNPQKPHENRDKFKTKLDNFITECDIDQFTDQSIINIIEEFNNYIKNNLNSLIRSKKICLTPKQKQKCIRYNWYLFSEKNWDSLLIYYYKNDYSLF